jgi:hypothetical protein
MKGRAGKTHYGLRPLITSALAAGWQVLIYDRSGLDFLPFQHHPNVQTVLLSESTIAIEQLALLYEEIQQRFAILRDNSASTWGRLPHPPAPRTLAILDEFANLADALSNPQREELWRFARMIAAEGRKAGIHLALALQDPTHRSLDLRIRRNPGLAGAAFIPGQRQRRQPGGVGGGRGRAAAAASFPDGDG